MMNQIDLGLIPLGVAVIVGAILLLSGCSGEPSPPPPTPEVVLGNYKVCPTNLVKAECFWTDQYKMFDGCLLSDASEVICGNFRVHSYVDRKD